MKLKNWLLGLVAEVIVALSFIGAAHAPSGVWRMVAIFAALMILQALFVQKYPKDEALKWATKLKRGQKVTVEGK